MHVTRVSSSSKTMHAEKFHESEGRHAFGYLRSLNRNSLSSARFFKLYEIYLFSMKKISFQSCFVK